MMIIQGIPGAFATFDTSQALDDGTVLGAGCRRRARYADMDGDISEEEILDSDKQELNVEPDEWSDEPRVFDLCDELDQLGGGR